MYAFIAAGLKAVRAFSSARAGPSPAPPRVSLATRWPHRRTHRASRLRSAARPEPKYAPRVRHFPDALTSGSGLRSRRGLVPRLPRPALGMLDPVPGQRSLDGAGVHAHAEGGL